MKLDELMKEKAGVWEHDIATIKNGAYFVQVARKRDGKIELTEEGLRSFPALGGRVVAAPVVEAELVVEAEPESSLDDDLAAALADEPEEDTKKKKHGK